MVDTKPVLILALYAFIPSLSLERCPITPIADSTVHVCASENVCWLWMKPFSSHKTRIVKVHNPLDIAYIEQEWQGNPTVIDPRASLCWDRDSKNDILEFTLRNTTRSDNGELVLDMDNKIHIDFIKTTLHVLYSCPARDMYLNPIISYQTKSSDVKKVHNEKLELTELGNVTLWVTIPAADPPVNVTISLGQSKPTSCIGKACKHSECTARLSFDKTRDTSVNVTLNFLALIRSTTIVKVVKKYSPENLSQVTPPVIPPLPVLESSSTSASKTASTGNARRLGFIETTTLLTFLALCLLVVIVCIIWYHNNRNRRARETPLSARGD